MVHRVKGALCPVVAVWYLCDKQKYKEKEKNKKEKKKKNVYIVIKKRKPLHTIGKECKNEKEEYTEMEEETQCTSVFTYREKEKENQVWIKDLTEVL